MVLTPNSLGFPADTPNADVHFCGGDAAQWSGIKRCGGAMHHGTCIAQNIHQTITSKLASSPHTPRFQELQEVPPMIGLAVGKTAVAYGPDVGTVSGEDVRQAYFRDDLGFESELSPLVCLLRRRVRQRLIYTQLSGIT